jgi:hypothetical protein
MTVMYKATIDWSGFPGAPGYTNLYAITTDPLQAGLDAFVGGIGTWLNIVKNGLTSAINLQINPAVELVEDVDGELVNIMSPTSAPAAVAGALGGGITGPSGAVVNWLTAGATFGRRRQGRSFIVPVAAASIDSTGTLDNSYRTSLQTASIAYASATVFQPCVWVRPITNGPDRVPPVANRAGQAVPMVSARVPDLAAVLRSRRD